MCHIVRNRGASDHHEGNDCYFVKNNDIENGTTGGLLVSSFISTFVTSFTDKTELNTVFFVLNLRL